MPEPIRLDEWAKALEELSARNAEGFTTQDLRKATGLSLATIRIKLGGLMEAGKVRRVGERAGENIAGRVKFSPVYQMVKGEPR